MAASRKSWISWVTFALDEDQVIQALVLGRSLRRVLTSRRLVVLTNNSILASSRAALEVVFDTVGVPEGIDHKNGISDELYCKLECWKWYMGDQCIFIQPDALVVKNCDELIDGPGFFFTTEGKKTRIDSSLFVSKPCPETYAALLQICLTNKIKKDISEAFLIHWGQDLKRLRDGIILQVDPWGFTGLLEEAQVSIVRIAGTSPSNVVAVNEQLPSGNFTKFLLNRWMDIFTVDVEPLLKGTKMASMVRNTMKVPNLEPIAIVGMGCRLPQANDLAEFWKLLIEGGDAIRSPPQGRLPPGVSSDLAKDMKAGFLKCEINEFDGKFFGISPLELSFLDPQTRILLEVLWEALEDAGVDPQSLKGTNAGIFTGAWTQDYKELINKSSKPTEDYFRKYMGNSFGACAGRLSFILGVTGPNIATESGCSSSMIGLDLACKSLRLGETRLAMACGVNLVLHHFLGNDMEAICAKDGHCKTFDASADGFGRAEGCGVLILKSYSDAVRDGDRIHALIRGMGAAQEGTSRSLGTPTVASEAAAMKMALKNAGVEPWEVSYVETHGTGTPVGDPMEMAAIAEAYSEGRTERLIVGSVKTNVGHTESCSGITGIIKTVLSLQNEIIPPHVNFKTLNPNINLDAIPAAIPLTATPWPREQGKVRYAGVSSFGITGTDAHAIIQEAPLPERSLDLGMTRPQHVLTVSAKSEQALEDLLGKYKQYMASEISTVGDSTFTANTGRAHLKHRAAIIGKTSSEIAKSIEKKTFIQGKTVDEGQKICFLFTGQGSQYVGMGKSLYETSPIFKSHFRNCEAILRKTFGVSILPVLWGDKPEQQSHISRTIYSQTSIFCIEYCLLKLWESWGVKPDCVLGHSLGEFAAATAAGILSLEDALTLVAERSRLIDNLPGGQMIVLKESKTSVERCRKEFQNGDKSTWLDFAAINSNEQTVLAGDTSTVSRFADFCINNNIKSIVLEASHAFHSRHMEPMLGEYSQVTRKIKSQPPTCTFVSGMDGKVLEAGCVNSDYWVRHTREPVQFMEACKVAYAEGCRTFLEIGPQPVLSALTMANSSAFETKDPIICLPSLRKNADEWITMLTSLSKLHVSGVKINWKNFEKFYGQRKVGLPTYPFQRKKFWFDSKSSSDEMHLWGSQIHPLIGCLVPNATSNSIYHGILDLKKIPYVKDHLIGETVIYPGAGYMEMSLAAGYSTTQGLTSKFEFPSSPISFENLTIEAPLELTETQVCQVQVIVTPDESSGSKVSVYRERILEDGSRKWIRHTSGKYSPFAIDYEEENKFAGEALSIIRSRITKEVDMNKFYSDLFNVGLKFGPNFRLAKRGWKDLKTGELVAEMKAPPDTAEYLCHPTIIDGMIQAFIANKFEEGNVLQVPVRIEKFIWFAKVDTDTLYAYSFPNFGSIFPKSVALYNPDGKMLALMVGIEILETSIAAVLSALKNQTLTLPPIYEDIWKSLPGPLERRADMIQTFRNEILSAEFMSSLAHSNQETETDGILFPQLNRLCYLYIQKALYNIGWTPTPGEIIQPPEFCERFSIQKSHERLLNRLFIILGEEGYVSGVQNSFGIFIEWRVTKMPPSEDQILVELDSVLNVLGRGTPEVYGATDVVAICGDKLNDILLGKEAAVDLMFPQNSREEESPAEKFYRLSTVVKYTSVVETKTLQRLIEKHMELPEDKRGVLQILEVGAGTGSLTRKFLPILDSMKVAYRYFYTDVSSGFFIKAERVFEPYAKNMIYKVFDLEKDPFDQGFAPQQFDLIVSVNVLHICKDLSQCMRNLRQLTTDGGLLYIAETTQPYREIDLTFGLFEGYWMYEDIETRPNHCLLSLDNWKRIIEANGYEATCVSPAHCNRGGVLIAKGSKIMPTYFSKQLELKPKSWIIFSGTREMNEYFAAKLRTSGRSVSFIQKSSKYTKVSDSNYEINPSEASQMATAFEEIKNQNTIIEGIIYLWGDDDLGIDQKQICEPFLYLSQLIGSGNIKPLPKVFIVTCGTNQVGDHVVGKPAAGTLWGFARALRAEIVTLNCKNIDTDPNDASDQRLEEAFSEMWKSDGEFQVAYRQRSRNVARMTTCKFSLSPLLLPNSDKFSLALPESKAINDLRIIPDPVKALKENEIEVQTKNFALNFKDILIILKPIKEFEGLNSFAGDFAGVITAVGSNVKDKKVGDAVCGCAMNAGATPSYVVVDSGNVVLIPDNWTYADAATLPVVFATAYYCMVTVADLKRDETILIHAASGGVGLVAIQLAKHLGVNIIATAGNERKRAYLRNLGIENVFNSRTLEYEQQIKEITGGKGVDMVLNCLTGPGFKEASLKVCATGARFVEMSKLDVWEEEDVTKLRPDVQYTIVDLTTVSKETWVMLFQKMQEVMNKNIFRPIPYTSFDLIHVREALNYLQKAKHIGKVIIEMPSQSNTTNGANERKFNLFNDRSCYLITGGLGGIGLEVAKWMASSGAKHIVLVGRSLPSTKASEIIESLTKNGMNIVTLQVDIGDLNQCQCLLETLKEPSLGLPTLRGIMHAAGTLSDGSLDSQSWSKFASTFHPKVNGGWNLHTLTKEYPLEHFVMYSSVVGLVGNVNQTNHAAGNAYLDALAYHRRSIGLPALTVNWGQWGEVGVAAEIKINGFRAFSPMQGVLALEKLMKSHKTQGCVYDADFGVIRKVTPTIIKYFDELRLNANVDAPGSNLVIDSKAFREQFDKATENQEKVEVVKSNIEVIIRQILKLDPEDEMDPTQNFTEVGLDSLMMVEMKNSVQALVGTSILLNPKDFADCVTLQLLSEHITKLLIEGLETEVPSS